MAIASAGQKQSADDAQTAQLQVTKAPKKAKTVTSSAASSSLSSAIQINIANHVPLNGLVGHCHINAPTLPATNERLQLTDYSHTSISPVREPTVKYLSVRNVLQQLHETFPAYNLPQYGTALSDHGIVNVDDV
jgi:hypothetical protein